MKPLKLASAMCLVLTLTVCASSPGDSGSSNPPDGDDQVDVTGSAERVPGTLKYYGEPVRIKVSKSVRQGRPFVVTIGTYGGGCIAKGEAEVEIKGLQAEVRLYDYDTAPTLPVNGTCTTDLRHYRHTVILNFGEIGTAEVIFYGQQEDSSGVAQTTLTRTLEVR